MNEPHQEIQCPLCGFRFPRDSAKPCAGCPMGKAHCQRLICCPHCGYGFVESSAIVEWVKKLLRRRSRHEKAF
ncbi:MAG: hypothetical protein ACUVS3_10325 [Thermodesulfobacteriota bacterium]